MRLLPIDYRWASTVLMLVVLSSYHIYELFFSEKPWLLKRVSLPRMKEKLIVAWTGFFNEESPFMTPSEEYLERVCGVVPVDCHVTSNRQMMDVSDAILFHWRDVRLKDLPYKHGGQRWALLNMESPYHVRPAVLQELSPYIDWMVTYRLDSDVYSPYGRYRPRTKDDVPVTEERNLQGQKKFKRKLLLAWMVSNCQTPSLRESLVDLLRKHLDVDVYGNCNGNRTVLEMTRDESYAHLAKRYKFYLAFENSICRDYATEKLFQPLYHGLVPVVYGGADYKRILPPNSYIDVLDFSTAEDLANHLLNAGSNWSVYSQYLQWKKKYVIDHRECENKFFCQMCSMLNRNENVWDLGNGRPSNQSLISWWNKTNDCANVSVKHFDTFKWLRERRREWFINS